MKGKRDGWPSSPDNQREKKRGAGTKFVLELIEEKEGYPSSIGGREK